MGSEACLLAHRILVRFHGCVAGAAWLEGQEERRERLHGVVLLASALQMPDGGHPIFSLPLPIFDLVGTTPIPLPTNVLLRLDLTTLPGRDLKPACLLSYLLDLSLPTYLSLHPVTGTC